jgi:hypothetical protein
VDVDLSELQAIRAALGGKVNDCILSVVVRAVSRYIRFHGEKVKGRFLRVACPVNVRGGEQGESLGNRITFLPVILPLDVRDPVEMLRAVTTRMEIMKGARAADVLAIFASCLGTAPTPVQEMFWRVLPLIPLPVPLLNMICTNVPGPSSPLYSVGRRLVAFYPQVPTGYELGLGVAVQSYDGKLCFGVIADAHVAPDAARLRDYIRTCFEELREAAGVKSARPQAPTPPARAARSRKHAEPSAAAVPVAASATPTAAAPEEQAPAPPVEAAASRAGDAVGVEPVQPELALAKRARQRPAAPRARAVHSRKRKEPSASGTPAAPEEQALAPPVEAAASLAGETFEGAEEVQPEAELVFA